MSDKKEPGGLLEAGVRVFDSLWNWSGATDMWRWTLMGAVVIICSFTALYFLVKALTAFLEVLLKCVDAYKTSGLPLWLNREDKIRVRRRSQFCTVLKADLAYIAKAESWNDQYFTDLEAEVETEGGYYASPIHKLIRRKSYGLRKEKSLVRAISTSSERAIQLTGEPGAGKSVALRHLAVQLAERGIRAKDKKALVPLYVNLRELSLPADKKVDADSIRDFIVDNVRRGDSDTSEFVRKNWEEYRDKGIWFFLFDSFDEIPAVLHAEKGSPATIEYSEAIRQFLDGMGACKGILASREFKGPEALPWKKFRILSLSLAKQEELVANSFLNSVQSKIVLLHLSSRSEGLAHTPLFLTLLCRYVKDEGCAPDNDYQLLLLQIERLARRDPNYLKRQYGLSPEDLLEGAERVARAFAEEPSIGLSPSVDQMIDLIHVEEIPGGDISRFIAAMVDCKIARADVPNLAPGDRRFAFAHRRYQEALFVKHLVKFPDYISAESLLTDPRWREYTVTLLETQPIEATRALLNAATDHLAMAAEKQQIISIEPPAEGPIGFFGWRSETVSILELLQEGLSRRIDEVPEGVKVKVAAFLSPRWENGDSLDKSYVVMLGALLPQHILAQYLAETFDSGTSRAQTIAFSQTIALRGNIPDVVRLAVLNKLAGAVLKAQDRATILKLEALVARLPPEVGAVHVFRRCQLIKTAIGVANWLVQGLLIPLRVLLIVVKPEGTLRRILTRQTSSPTAAIFAVGMFVLYASCMLSLGFIKYESSPHLSVEKFGQANIEWWLSNGAPISKFFVAAIFALASTYFVLPLLYLFRAYGGELGVRYFLQKVADPNYLKESLRALLGNLATLVGIVVMVLLCGKAFKYVAMLFGIVVESSPWVVGVFPMMGLVVLLAVGVVVYERRRSRRANREFAIECQRNGGEQYPALLNASDVNQLAEWLFEAFRDDDPLSLGEQEVRRRMLQTRSLSAILQALNRGQNCVVSVTSAPSTTPLCSAW